MLQKSTIFSNIFSFFSISGRQKGKRSRRTDGKTKKRTSHISLRTKKQAASQKTRRLLDHYAHFCKLSFTYKAFYKKRKTKRMMLKRREKSSLIYKNRRKTLFAAKKCTSQGKKFEKQRKSYRFSCAPLLQNTGYFARIPQIK